MNSLILHTEQIKDKVLRQDFEETAQAFPVLTDMVQNRECEFLAPLKIRAKIFRIRELFEVEGTFQTRVRLTCSRCLKDFDTSLSSDFELTYTKETPGLTEESDPEEVECKAEETGLIYFKGEQIDLHAGIQEQIVMAFPLQPLCDADCKGLCPECGADLNRRDCRCKREPASNKFAVLKNLKLRKK